MEEWVVTSFQEKVYSLTRKIPKGRVSSYSDVAHALDCAAYRAVGQALTRNRDPRTPCHRVVNSGGRVGGYAFNTPKKIKILRSEGVKIDSGRISDFERVRFQF